MKFYRYICVLLYLNFIFGTGVNIYDVDFQVSLGKNNPYYARSYKDLFKNLNNPKCIWSIIGTAPKSVKSLYELCLGLYKSNKLTQYASIPLSETPRIPKIIHQIWLGSKLPERYKKWQKTWEKIHGWEYKLWTEKEIKNIKLMNQKHFDKAKNYGERSDILRAEILYQFGGIYVDTDFECINSDFFNFLNNNYDFYAGLHPLDSNTFSICNAIVASVPNHPILKWYIDNLKYQNNKDIVIRTGPGLLTKAFIHGNSKLYRNIVLPPTFFYPIGNKEIKRNKKLTKKQIKTRALKPESVAIHWWESSWEKKAGLKKS